jgi:hypothetical protein
LKYSLLPALLIAALAGCSPKASKSTAATPSPSNGPGEAQLAAAKTRFTGVTLAELKKGHEIFYGPCTNCHGAKGILTRDEKEWVSIVDRMAPKAHLKNDEKEAVWRYIMSVKLSAN